jgi:hypothetical protein
MISQQLVNILDDEEPAYEVPVPANDPAPSRTQDACGVGYDTLTRIVREELRRYKENSVKKAQGSCVRPHQMTSGGDVKQQESPSDIYAEIGSFNGTTVESNSNSRQASVTTSTAGCGYETLPVPKYPPPPVPQTPHDPQNMRAGPPLPKRGFRSMFVVDNPNLFMTLQRIEKSAAIMETCFTTLTQNGLKSPGDWKLLGLSLPVCSGSFDKVEKRLKAIEQRYPGDRRKQAMTVLVEWRKWRGEQANVRTLLDTLRECGFMNDAALVEQVADQSTV